MLLDELGFDERAIRVWESVLRLRIPEIKPNGSWAGVVEDACAQLPVDAHEDARLLILGVVSSAEWKDDYLRKFYLETYQFGALISHGATKAQKAALRNSYNKNHLHRFRTLLCAGYAKRRGDTTISKATWVPLAQALAACSDCNMSRKEEDLPEHHVYKALQRRFHALRKKADLSADDLLDLGEKLFVDLRNSLGLHRRGINRRVTGR